MGGPNKLLVLYTLFLSLIILNYFEAFNLVFEIVTDLFIYVSGKFRSLSIDSPERLPTVNKRYSLTARSRSKEISDEFKTIIGLFIDRLFFKH